MDVGVLSLVHVEVGFALKIVAHTVLDGIGWCTMGLSIRE